RPTELPAPSTPSARPMPTEPPRLRSTLAPKAEPSSSLRITAATPTRPAAEPKTSTGISTAQPDCPHRIISAGRVTSASDKCVKERRKTNDDDIIWSLGTLGFEEYVEPVKIYLNNYRERTKYNNMEPDAVDFFGECMNSPRNGRTPLANEIYEQMVAEKERELEEGEAQKSPSKIVADSLSQISHSSTFLPNIGVCLNASNLCGGTF
ncbi:hypothetical protein ACJX0J_033760, partial [Zea mays]